MTKLNFVVLNATLQKYVAKPETNECFLSHIGSARVFPTKQDAENFITDVLRHHPRVSIDDLLVVRETTNTMTKGPWKAGEVCYPDGIEVINISAPDGYHVCKVSSRQFEDEGSENVANANAIAAIPELIEACKPIDDLSIFIDKPEDDDFIMVTYGTVKKIKEALAKARGEI